MKLGYLRVSTEEQRPDRQIDALEPLCDRLYIEKTSAIAKNRPIFEEVMAALKPGDTFVVWDLDRAFRSTIDALMQAEQLHQRGIEFQIVTLGVNTSTAHGKLVYTVIAAFAQHERDHLSERTKQGLEAAVRRGAKLGRKPKVSRRDALLAKDKIDRGSHTVEELANLYGVHPRTLSRRMKTASRD
ncbi:MAG: recombinase family protein [Pseudomonadota bacterium]